MSMKYVEDRPRLSVLAPRYFMLFVDLDQPQGSDRTYVADLATIAHYLTTEGPPGDSAYQVARSAGFVGTVAEWLATLRGPQGPAGDPNRRSARVPIGSGLLAPNAVQTLRVTWSTPFEDDKYTISETSFESSSLLGSVQVEIRKRDKAWVDLVIKNGLISLTMQNVLLHVTANHDA